MINFVNKVGTTTPSDFSEVGVAGGLVAWWPFEGNANDLTENKYNGTPSNTAVASGIDGLCYSFNGTTSVIDLPNAVGYTTIFSASAWFKSLGAPLNGYHVIMGGQHLEISSNHSTGALRVGVYCGSTRYVNDFGSGLTNGNWHFVTSVFDGSTLSAYLDGSYVGQITGITGTLVYSSSRRIGQFNGGNDYVTNGLIDDVRIYNRTLSAQEIKIQYELIKNKVMNIDSADKLYIAGRLNEVY